MAEQDMVLTIARCTLHLENKEAAKLVLAAIRERGYRGGDVTRLQRLVWNERNRMLGKLPAGQGNPQPSQRVLERANRKAANKAKYQAELTAKEPLEPGAEAGRWDDSRPGATARFWGWA